MKFEQRVKKLKEKAEQLVNFTVDEISQLGSDEIQRLLYDLQVYQIELEMQNDELQKTEHELTLSRNRYSFLYHQIAVGIVTVNSQGFILEINHCLCQMVNIEQQQLINKHITSLILEEDKNMFINRFDAFFKSPARKSLNLRLLGNQKQYIVGIGASAGGRVWTAACSTGEEAYSCAID